MQTIEIHATPEPVEIDPGRTAVLVIDMQNAFGSPGGMFDKAGVPITNIQAAVAPTRAAVEAARRAGVKIVYLKMGSSATPGAPTSSMNSHQATTTRSSTRLDSVVSIGPSSTSSSRPRGSSTSS
jgi:nicotinamidase-related amidase